MKYENIVYKKEQAVCIITMNRPEAVNALSLEHVDELNHAMEMAEKDDEIKAIIITGGNSCFSAGFDLKYFAKGRRKENKAILDVIDKIRDVEKKIESLRQPVIAAISGPCLAGGLEIAISCDLRIASENAVFGFPEIKFGALAIAGATQRLPRMIPVGLAKELHFLGESIDANEAYRIGLVNKVVPNGAVLVEAMKLASRLAERSPVAVKLCKFLINTGLKADLNTAMEFERKMSLEIINAPEFEEARSKAGEKEAVYRHIFNQPGQNS